jgi:uncharacterized protein (DUF1501 family)
MKKTQKLNRRDFIKLSSIASAALPITLSGFPLFANEKPKGYQITEENDNILVLIQLQGGNDGLNTIFNLNQYANLQNVRSNIIIPENSLISLDDSNRLHPSMVGMKNIWEQENLGIIQNVGYPNQNRSHFRSTDIWNSASSAEAYISSGWMGRFFDRNHASYPTEYPNTENPHPFAITLGKIVSETCQGTNANFSMALRDPANPGTAVVSNTGEIPNNCYGDALKFVNETVSQTNAYAEIIVDAANAGTNLSTKYENSNHNKLAGKLKNVAKLISGGLQTKVYVVQLGGFDTHDNQVVDGETTSGKHGELLRELSEAIAAFQDDLELLGIDHKVMGMTYSEFGRRIRSNDALGTDHGNAAPMFLFGSCAKNQILGDAPEIDTQVDFNEGVQMQYDFRTIYSSILTDWLGATPEESGSILFDNFETLPILKEGCNGTLATDNFELEDSFTLDIYPNPSQDFIHISFHGPHEIANIKLYNSIGGVVKQIANHYFTGEKQFIKVDLRKLSPGTYFVHYQSKRTSKTKKVLKY